MPFATVDNIRLFYRLEGKADRTVLVLSHSIGTDHGMWAPQVEDLLAPFSGAAIRHSRTRRVGCAHRRILG